MKTELTSVMADDGGVLRAVTLLKASSMQFTRPRSGCSGGTLDLGIPDRMMTTLDTVLPPGGIVLEQLLVKGEEGGTASSCTYGVFGGDVKACLITRCYAQLCLVR